MKANPLMLTFLLLLAVTLQLPAQQSEADRKLLADIRAKAEKGDAECQYALALAFNFGSLGVAQDYVEAVKWYRKAAEQNYAWAESNLGVCYEEGRGVVKDEVEAVKWYRKAANQGDSIAQSNLGAMYDDGQGVPQNYDEAVKWYRKSAEQNCALAQNNLGLCYDNGQGVVKNEAEAVKWFRKAAEQNFADAQFNLSVSYREGVGVTKDIPEAINWSRKAAEQGFAVAQYDLSLYYWRGDGVPQNFVEACKWNILASAQGNNDAKKTLPSLKRLMTSEQIAEAQQLSSEFKPHKVSSSKNSTSSENPFASGTGFFITDDGYLISNYHVVKDATKVRLVTSVGLISVKVISVDAANDLALLKADGRFARLPISPSQSAQLGSTVATVGFPNIGLQGFAPKLTKGEISSLSGVQDDLRYFQISVPVQPGNSGGALVDEHGNVVGVVSAKLSARAALAASGALPENVNYAVKSSFLLGFLDSVPAVSAKLKAPVTADRKFEDVVKSARDAAVLVLVY